MKILITAIVAVLGLSACAVPVTQSVEKPAETTSSTRTPKPIGKAVFIVAAMEDNMTRKQRKLICDAWDYSPTAVWEQFNSGADDEFTRRDFTQAITYLCKG